MTLGSACSSYDNRNHSETAVRNEPIEIKENTDSIIRHILHLQTVAWNEGDIEGFMDGYWNNERLTFVGSKGLQYGWKNTLEGYKKSYPTPDAMGELRFELIEMKPLGLDHFYTIGMWQLNRETDTLAGYYNLIWERTPEGWKIISDHSS